MLDELKEYPKALKKFGSWYKLKYGNTLVAFFSKALIEQIGVFLLFLEEHNVAIHFDKNMYCFSLLNPALDEIYSRVLILECNVPYRIVTSIGNSYLPNAKKALFMAFNYIEEHGN